MLALIHRLETAWARRHVRLEATDAGDAGLRPVAVITGASEGIGRALAREFAAAGHDLMLVARSEQRLGEAAEALAGEFGVAAYPVAADLAADGPTAVHAALAREGLYADILVNNAGIGMGGYFHDRDHEELLRLVDLNVRALSDLTRRFLPGMIRRGRGGVLNVASLGGLLPGPYQAAYYASKAYVIALTEALAHETAGRGVRMSVLVPGPVATGFHEKMGTTDAYYLKFLGAMDAVSVARIGYAGFRCRRTVIVPGLVPSVLALAIRLTPHFILVPFIGWLLRRRY